MPIEIIPKQEEKKPLLPEILFYFSLILVISAVASYFVLNNLSTKTESDVTNLNQQIKALSNSPEGKLESKLQAEQRKINDFSSLVNGYRYSSQIFPFIESLAHPQVTFSDFSADIEDGTLELSGTADSFQTVAQQLMIFQQSKLVKSAEVSDVSLGTAGQIPFTFDLVLNPAVFSKTSAASTSGATTSTSTTSK